MGLGVLDSDESNQSTLIGNAIASLAQPSSALSMIPSEISNDSNPNSPCMMSSDIDDSTTKNLNRQLSDTSHLSSNDVYPSQPLRSDSKSTDNSFAASQLHDNQFNIYNDYTPANLVPPRTNFRGAINSEESSSLNRTLPSHSSAHNVATGEMPQHQPEGRAIRSTSMKQFNKQNADFDSAKKYKGRSPLATIGNLAGISSPDKAGSNEKKALSAEDSFFMYQKRDPRLYTGEDNFARLSDEVLLSIFKWLPKKTLIRCSLVNRRFHRVTQDESLWTRLDLAGKTIQPHAMGRILSRGVVIIRLAQCKVINSNIFK